MGGINSKDDSQQVLIVGPQKAGKTLFYKRFIDRKKDIEQINLEPTLGFNHTTTKYENISFDLWDIGGDPLTKSYWPTFYRNLRFTLVVFVINIADEFSYANALKDVLILLNEEELKLARFFILFNIIIDEEIKKKLGDNLKKEFRDRATELMNSLKECNVHEFDSRVSWQVFDILRLTDADCEFFSNCFIGDTGSK